MLSEYSEQWNRVQRYLLRFKSIVEGRSHTMDSSNYQDDVYAFFLNCYHLKDWIKNDAACRNWQPAVENFINHSRELRICADLCNGLKHVKLTKPRSELSPSFAQVAVHVIVADAFSERETVSLKATYIIETTTGYLDGLELASQCVEQWGHYIESNSTNKS